MMQRILLAVALGLMLPLTLPAAPENEAQLEDYRVSYDALLANGSVEDAYQLARDVSHRYPDNQEWKRRLARVAVWTNRPVEAYTTWKELFQSGERDSEVLSEVRRLASHYNDAPILIELWQATETTRQMSKQEAEALAKLYERAYRPIEGARYFEQLHKTRRRAVYGEQAAQLYERSGSAADAVRVYRALLASAPGNKEWLMTAARLEIRRDRRAAALKLLKRHQRYMPDDAFDYWQMLGELAWAFQDDTTATAAYRRASLASSASLVERDRLTYLLLDKDPLQAAAMSLRYYREGAGSAWLLRALEIQVAQKAWPQARESLALAQGKELQSLKKNARYLILRAQISRHFGENGAAVADMRRALELAPDDTSVQLSALWQFIAANDRNALAAMVARIDPQTGDPRYWQALTAAHQALGNYPEALDYAQLQLERKPNDPLVLLSNADLLEITGQTEMETYYRQRSWQYLKTASPSGNRDRYLARIRTELSAQPGDAAALQVRHLQAQNSGHTAERELDETLLAWALENGQIESAQAWSHQRFDDKRSLPLWAQLQLALETHDYETLQHLLGREGNSLAAGNAHEAATRTGNWPLARKLAFEGAQYNPDDNELHQRLLNTIERHGDAFEITGRQAAYNDLDNTLFQLRADKALSTRWRLAVNGYRAEQSLITQTELQSIPSTDNGVTLEAQWSDPLQQWHFALGRHNELNDYTGWQIGYANTAVRRVQLEMHVAGGQPTEHSTALQVAGYADYARLNAGMDIDRHLHLAVQLSSERYHTQYDTELGSGTQLYWEAGYTLRSSYPDWNIRGYGAHYRFKADGLPDERTLQLFTSQTRADATNSELTALFIPEDNDYLGLCGGAGQNLRHRYSRAFRPLAEACAIYSDKNGDGYSLLAGLTGSLTGPDQVSLLWEKSHAGRQAVGRDVTLITLSYQHFF